MSTTVLPGSRKGAPIVACSAADRPVEAEQALEFALDIDDILTVDQPESAGEELSRERELRRKRQD